MDRRVLRVTVACATAMSVLALCSVVAEAERIGLLLLVEDGRIDNLRMFFDAEPSVRYSVVVTRDPRIPDKELTKLIRLYFPRTYQDFVSYDVVMLCKPSYDLFTPKQDKWIHDAVFEGAGGMNDGSVFSQIPGIPQAWAAGLAWQAFPNDAPAVAANYGSWAPLGFHWVEINEDHPEPILTIFVPLGVEKAMGGLSRLVIPRQGSDVLAWQVGNYPRKEPYLVTWHYGEGRAMTIGGVFPGGWLAYPRESDQNRYAPEIVMNMMFWLADTELIDDVEVFHRVKTDFAEFVERLRVLISLKDFIDKFGANTDRIHEGLASLEEIYAEAAGTYLEHSFADSEVGIRSALAMFPAVEDLARREKDRALVWVYLIEWLVSASVLFISGFILWSLMVRRQLYRSVETTKLGAVKQ